MIIPRVTAAEEATMSDGLVLLAAWGQFFVLVGVLTFFVLRGRKR